MCVCVCSIAYARVLECLATGVVVFVLCLFVLYMDVCDSACVCVGLRALLLVRMFCCSVVLCVCLLVCVRVFVCVSIHGCACVFDCMVVC